MPQKTNYFCRGKDCIENFCKKLKEIETEIINYEVKEMISSTDKENKSYEKQKECHICKEEFCYNKNKEKEFELYQKARDHCHYTGKFRGAAHSICNLCYKVLIKIHILIHNCSTYDDHFIIKQLLEEFKGKFECLGENTEKYITFSVLIKKEIVINDDDEDDDIKKEEESDCDSKEEESDCDSKEEEENDCDGKEEEVVNNSKKKKRKQSHTKYSLLIAIDLCQANYLILLITCLEFLIKNVYNVRKEKKIKMRFYWV